MKIKLLAVFFASFILTGCVVELATIATVLTIAGQTVETVDESVKTIRELKKEEKK